MVNFKKYGVLAAALLCASAAGISFESPGGEFLAYAYYYDKDEFVELEGAEAGVKWDPNRYMALTRLKALPVGSWVEVRYTDDKGNTMVVKVLIVGLCPEEMKEDVEIMLSYAAARRIKIDRAKERRVPVRLRVIRREFTLPRAGVKG